MNPCLCLPDTCSFLFQAENGIRDAYQGLEFRRVLFRSPRTMRGPHQAWKCSPRNLPKRIKFGAIDPGVWRSLEANGPATQQGKKLHLHIVYFGIECCRVKANSVIEQLTFQADFS